MNSVDQKIMNTNIEQKVVNIVAEVFKVSEDKVSRESRFTEDLGADSLDKVDLVMAFETEFGCDIPDEAASKIFTVKDAIDFIEKVNADIKLKS